MRWLSVILLTACAADPTGILLTVESDGSLDQLRVEAPDAMLGPDFVPETPGSVGAEESITVFVPSELDGMSVQLVVEGSIAGAVQQRGEASVIIVAGEFVELRVVLGPLCEPVCSLGERCVAGACECDPETCAGCCSDEGCLVGDENAACGTDGMSCVECGGTERCVAGACTECDATSCASGCCAATGCVDLGFPNCRPDGMHACEACDVDRSDQCLDGGCSCGTSGVPCPDGEVCVDGSCECGDGPGCVPGQRCFLGTSCECDAVSCPTGCCSASGMCRPGSSAAECGAGGGSCVRCDGGEICEEGECD